MGCVKLIVVVAVGCGDVVAGGVEDYIYVSDVLTSCLARCSRCYLNNDPLYYLCYFCL